MGYYGKELAQCSLCGGTLPEFDVEIQIEHMIAWHKASSDTHARNMASRYFVKVEGALYSYA